MVVENVRGAQCWVGPAKAHFGSFYLWGDVETVGNKIVCGPNRDWLRIPKRLPKVRRLDWSKYGDPDYKPQGFNVMAAQNWRKNGEGTQWRENGCNEENRMVPSGRKLPGNNAERRWEDREVKRLFDHAWHLTNQRESDAVKVGGDYFSGELIESNPRRHASKSNSRKATSAMIAKIPLPLSRFIARAFKPR